MQHKSDKTELYCIDMTVSWANYASIILSLIGLQSIEHSANFNIIGKTCEILFVKII